MLRPEPGASSTLERARAAGLDAFSLPLFKVEALAWSIPAGEFDGLLLTSANGVRNAGRQLQSFASLPVFAVGPETAAAAEAAGLRVVTVGAGGVEALLSSVPPGLRLLHLCGEDRRVATASGQSIASVEVYRSAMVPQPAGLERLQGSIALIHSPRAARRLAELVEQRHSIAIAAISPAAAEASGGGWETVRSADKPTDEALLSLAARLCKQSAPK